MNEEHLPFAITKLRPPQVRSGTIDRPGLCQSLTSQQERLTLVSAPAGWGKSTLLAQVVRVLRDDRWVAFISLDQWDSDPKRFWETMLAALRQQGVSVGTKLPSTPGAVGPGLDTVALAHILNELAATEPRGVMVLDDFHHIQHPGVHDAVSYLVEHAIVARIVQ